ncbi:transmembrane protein 200A [Chanos chanos]|uniref:Transmembrane protein 200A n=1 Tax=Chanos chanos TaxID=29144 RepID=A0A6J2WFI9_CHACN|nr:transmembrane protein 200A-like [Chanos chanos]
MKTQKSSQGRTPATPSNQRLPRFSLRSRKKKEGVIKGKLRIRSMPGAFLVLGVFVVIVGTALAVAGYWPYRAHRSAMLGQKSVEEGLSGAQGSGWGLGAKGLFSTANLIHSERMKLLGPVIMGVGLFILICANTVLYENRDRETQMLLAQMRSVICSVSAAVPSADLTRINTMSRQYQWVSSLPAAHLNILCLQELASSEPVLRVRSSEEAESRPQRNTLRTEVLHHQESASTPSVHSSNSCNSSKVDFNTFAATEQRAGSTTEPQHETLFKLSNCLTTSSMSTLEGEDWEAAAVPPRRSHSMSYRTNPRAIPKAIVHLDERFAQATSHPTPLLRESSSEVCVNVAGLDTVTLNLGPVEEQKHRSWPRLDLGCARKYLKLENKEDSVDKLLDQLEQQCSQWDKSYGSGPFQ